MIMDSAMLGFEQASFHWWKSNHGFVNFYLEWATANWAPVYLGMERVDFGLG